MDEIPSSDDTKITESTSHSSKTNVFSSIPKTTKYSLLAVFTILLALPITIVAVSQNQTISEHAQTPVAPVISKTIPQNTLQTLLSNVPIDTDSFTITFDNDLQQFVVVSNDTKANTEPLVHAWLLANSYLGVDESKFVYEQFDDNSSTNFSINSQSTTNLIGNTISASMIAQSAQTGIPFKLMEQYLLSQINTYRTNHNVSPFASVNTQISNCALKTANYWMHRQKSDVANKQVDGKPYTASSHYAFAWPWPADNPWPQNPSKYNVQDYPYRGFYNPWPPNTKPCASTTPAWKDSRTLQAVDAHAPQSPWINAFYDGAPHPYTDAGGNKFTLGLINAIWENIIKPNEDRYKYLQDGKYNEIGIGISANQSVPYEAYGKNGNPQVPEIWVSILIWKQ